MACMEQWVAILGPHCPGVTGPSPGLNRCQKRSGIIAVRLEDVQPRVVEATGSGMTYGQP